MKTIQLRCTFMSQPVDASGAGSSLGMERQILYHFLLHDQSRLLSDELCQSHQEVGHRAQQRYTYSSTLFILWWSNSRGRRRSRDDQDTRRTT